MAITRTLAQWLPSARLRLPALLLFAACAGAAPALAQTKDEVDAAKRALDLKIYQATTDALVAQHEAEARKATAEAERAELLARLPPVEAKALQGTIGADDFGAAGLVKAFDLAQQLAGEVCAALPADRKTVVHDAAITQGVVGARMTSDAIGHLAADLGQQNKQLQAFIDRHTPPAAPARSVAWVGIAAVPATIRAVADVTSLFKTNVTVAGIAYGEGARAMFASALGMACPGKIAGLGSGYLGELDTAQHEKLLARVRALVMLRTDYAGRIAIVQQLADGAKGEAKKELAAVATAAGALVKTVDAFVDSLKVGEAGDRSPLFNAARYLGYAGRTSGALVLDFDLRLEGMTLIKQNLFTGQHLRLSGVAFLWYRAYETNGALRTANAVRRITAPVEVDLRGTDVAGEFWDAPAARPDTQAGGSGK